MSALMDSTVFPGFIFGAVAGLALVAGMMWSFRLLMRARKRMLNRTLAELTNALLSLWHWRQEVERGDVKRSAAAEDGEAARISERVTECAHDCVKVMAEIDLGDMGKASLSVRRLYGRLELLRRDTVRQFSPAAVGVRRAR
jgi:hypothetical protein